MKLDVIEVLASETLSSLARGKWIEAADSVITKVSEVSSIARGKWIEASHLMQVPMLLLRLPSQEGSGLKQGGKKCR